MSENPSTQEVNKHLNIVTHNKPLMAVKTPFVTIKPQKRLHIDHRNNINLPVDLEQLHR